MSDWDDHPLMPQVLANPVLLKSISTLPLRDMIKSNLLADGIEFLFQLTESTETALNAVPNIGGQAIFDIKEVLTPYGLALRNPRSEQKSPFLRPSDARAFHQRALEIQLDATLAQSIAASASDPSATNRLLHQELVALFKGTDAEINGGLSPAPLSHDARKRLATALQLARALKEFRAA